MTAIVWFGLGEMGLPMASRLVDLGFEVRLGSPRGRVQEFHAPEFSTDSSGDAQPPIVALCLPSGREVEEIVREVQPAAFVVDFTSHDPATAEMAATVLQERGIGYVDCPVSGSSEGARRGHLTGLVGARPGDLSADVRAAIGGVCQTVVWAGALGRGQAIKLVNQVIHIGNVQVLGEGFELARRLGVDDLILLKALSASSGASRMLDRFGQKIMRGDHDRQFSVRLASKDIDNARVIAPDLPVTRLVAQRLRHLADDGFAEDNFTRLATRSTEVLSPTERAASLTGESVHEQGEQG